MVDKGSLRSASACSQSPSNHNTSSAGASDNPSSRDDTLVQQDIPRADTDTQSSTSTQGVTSGLGDIGVNVGAHTGNQPTNLFMELVNAQKRNEERFGRTQDQIDNLSALLQATLSSLNTLGASTTAPKPEQPQDRESQEQGPNNDAEPELIRLSSSPTQPGTHDPGDVSERFYSTRYGEQEPLRLSPLEDNDGLRPQPCTSSPPKSRDPYTTYCDVAVQPQVIPINQLEPPKFNGDRASAREWLRGYNNVMNINGYNDDQKLKRALAYMTGEGSNWLTATLRLEKDLDWRTFRDQFFTHFCGADGQDILRKKLDQTKQKADESPSTFMVRMIDLCLQYDQAMSDQELTRRIANGLRDEIHNGLLNVKPRSEWSPAWFKSVFAGYRYSQLPDKRSREQPKESPQQRKSTSTPARLQPRDLSSWVCFNCDKTGHMIDDCPKPRDEAHIKLNKESYKKERRENGDASERAIESVQHARNTSSRGTRNSLALPCDVAAKPILTVSVNGHNVSGRIDTGADMSVISDNVARKLKLNLQPWNQPSPKTANNSTLKITGMASVLITYEKKVRPLMVVVVPDKSFNQTLWGMDFLQAFAIKLDFSKDPRSTNANVGARSANTVEIPLHPIDKVKIGDLDVESRTLLENTLIKHQDTFSRNDLDIGRTNTVKHRIQLIDDKPVYQNYYRVAVRDRDAMEQQISKLLATGAIRESKSPYAAPGFFVSKDEGRAKRLVADYQRLNNKTIPDRTPMPHPEDVFGMLSGMKTFAKLDITSMFNQIEIDERDIEKTAMITPFGLFECPLMPFGLMNAPATAVRLMNEVLRGLVNKSCYVYFDDIIIFARELPQLVQRCDQVLTKLREHNLKIRPSKCAFAVDKVKFLGHIVSAQGVDVDPKRIEEVKNFPIPKNPSDVRSFHGLCSYNRKFIRGFADIAKPLTPLMGKPADFAWTPEAQKAFETLRDALITTPTLKHFNPDADHELRTDASSYAMGAVLFQKHPDPQQTGTVLYYSKTLTLAQQNYSATERELLAAFSAIMELQHYLIGKRFTLVTDHAALSLLRNHRDPHHRLARWVAQLQGFEFDVVYKKGSLHLDADCMSRLVDRPDPVVDVDHADCVRSICEISSQEFLDNELQQQNDEAQLDIRSEQREDSYCNKYIEILESTTLSVAEKRRRARNFTMQDELLYRVQYDDIFLLVIPERRRSAVLLSCHDIPLAGHLGFSKTFSVIKCRYYWPKMRSDVKKYVLSCADCQRRKASNVRKQGFTRPLPIAEDVFDTVGIDLITKLPRSHSGFNTIFVCTDNLSKYVIAVPIKDELAQTIVHTFFNQVIAKHGCPRVVLSDRGANISGERSRDFFRLFGIKRILTSPYHPQTNGQTERFNRTLAASLTVFVERNQKDWSDYVAAITFAYNISEHAVTHTSPFELVFGRKPRIPIDNLLDRSEFINPMAPRPVIKSSVAMDLMKKQILDSQLANKRRLDAHLDPCTYKEGDWVMFERPTRAKGQATKLTFTYTGPYKIIRKINDLSFELANVRNQSKPYIVHPCHLKLYRPRDDVVADDRVDPTFIPREQISLQPNESGDIETESADESEEEEPSPEFEPFTPPRLTNGDN